ncbi:MAG: tRNA pseudouridine(38-40) synthase TruA, partial [Acidobacteria bacterium]|nr:tRNA pseudouridine(38-40) synthase TruA [Acidobacteriota bacterium]
MARFLLTIQYLGTRYAGWQSQQNAQGVQDVIEEALATMCQGPITLFGAGRTDSGVHARGQCAHVDLPIDIDPWGFVRGLNTMLPDDIRLVGAKIVDGDFHARYHSTGKLYVYRIWNAEVADVFTAPTHAMVKTPLDETLMQEAAKTFVGKHDFRGFTIADPPVKTTVRTIRELRVTRDRDVIEILAWGDGFLRYMVRRIVGLLIEIGARRVALSRTSSFLEPEFAVLVQDEVDFAIVALLDQLLELNQRLGEGVLVAELRGAVQLDRILCRGGCGAERQRRGEGGGGAGG